jgi:CheY-like chemotaxis protein
MTQAMLYQHLLQKNGFQVKIARSGKKALEQIEIEKPGIVLTDINMPEMSGYELARSIKSNDTTRDIIVILLTTTLSPDAIFECMNSSADEISLKSLKEEAFLDLFERSVARQIKFLNPPSAVEAEVTEGGQSVSLKINDQQGFRLLLSVYDLLRKVQEG